MRKTIVPLGILLLFLSTSVLEAKEKNKYKHWLKEEVSLLLSKEEKSEFKALRTAEEKDEFIQNFWAMRDPTPETEENEFKDEWYRRLEYVNKTYTRGTKKGWRSDMGRVYLFFGPPWQITIKPPEKRRTPIGGHQQDLGDQAFFYKPKPHLQLFSMFEIVFKEYQWGYELADETQLIIRRALDMYPNSVIVKKDQEIH